MSCCAQESAVIAASGADSHLARMVRNLTVTCGRAKSTVLVAVMVVSLLSFANGGPLESGTLTGRDNNNVTQARSVGLSQYKSREWGVTFEYPSYPQFTQYFTVPSSLQPGRYLVYVSDELGKSNEVGVIVVEAK
jgi:hypothetical protein